MTLAQFAIAVNADPKWVQNAAASFGRYLQYTEEEARRVGLARLIHVTVGTPLRAAYEMAEHALVSEPPADTIVAESPDGSVRLTVDVHRFLVTSTVWLSHAYHHEPRARGRPAVRERSAEWAARARGLDVSLIDSNLRRPLAERIREADENAELMNRIRGSGRA